MTMSGKTLWVLVIAIGILGWGVSVDEAAEKTPSVVPIRGAVQDKSGQAIANATVYLIPTADVLALRKAPSTVTKSNVPDDEPMEDTLAANRDKYQKATTDQKGNFTIGKVAQANYFIYVEPSDREHLPGGDQSNKALSASVLSAKPIRILLSGKTPDNAIYVGSSQCMACHQQYGDEKKTLHKLGISVVGARRPAGLFPLSRFQRRSQQAHGGGEILFLQFR
jgi:hypothetical protein